MAYASKYYDPQKAHAYYMENRVLKGYENRYGGARGDGKSAVTGYVKKESEMDTYNKKAAAANFELDEKQKHVANAGTVNVGAINKTISEHKKEQEKYIKDTNDKIKALREELRNMSKEDRAANRDSIGDQIFELQENIRQARQSSSDTIRSYKLKIREAKQEQQDAAQRLRQQKKGGSTSGFNERGKEAASYIKSQMEKERDELISKVNKETDDKMLNDVKALVDNVNKIRSKGKSYSSKKLLGRINSMLNDVKKTKLKNSAKHKASYKVKYKEEIDKLREDDSMFSYWDKREEKMQKQQNADDYYEKKRQEKLEKDAEKSKARTEKREAQKAKRAERASRRR